jgi:hypothetical protein
LPKTTSRGKVKAKSFTVVRSDLPDVYLPPPPAAKGTQAWKAWAKEAFLELLRNGYTIQDAVDFLGVSRGWWEKNGERDPSWKKRAQDIRNGDASEDERLLDYPDISNLTYSEFAEQFLGLKVFAHQQAIVDAIEDGNINKLIVNGFPESGKSTHVSLGYILYRICLNPDLRVALVSKSQTQAEALLRRLKRYMTEEHLYEDTERNLIQEFKGFKPDHGSSHPWDQERITIRQRRSGERDPTVQALGIGAQIYGTRIDLLVLDDALTLENQQTPDRREKLDSWFLQEAASRAHKGEIVVVGTRIHPDDNFQSWRKAWGPDPHAKFVDIPAIVVVDGEEKSVWPEYWPLDGQMVYDEFNKMERYQKGLRDIRSEMEALGAWRWRLIYQQEDVTLDSTIFSQEIIDRALEAGKDRSLGMVFPHEILILGVDPAITGRAAAVLLAYDPRSRRRTVVDLFVGDRLGATGVRERLLYQFWEKYRPQRTLVEVNYAPTLLADQVLRTRAEAAGTILLEHKTYGRGKRRGSINDEEYGIAALAPLFSGGLVVLPSSTPADLHNLQPLIEDLKGFPYRVEKDALVGLWIAEAEVEVVATPTPDADAVIRGRNLPPKIARRLRNA